MTVSDDPEADAAFVRLAADDPEAAARTFLIVRGFDWTRGAITAAGQFGWFAELPLEQRVTLPDGTRVLLVHAAPGTDEGPGITVEQSDAELGALLDGVEADLVIVGHTHEPLDRTVDGVRVVNLGSVSNPGTDDLRAMWTLLEGDEAGFRLERRFAAYDVPTVLERLHAVHHPAGAYIRTFFERS
jgi:predicted phosphodiesterase